MNVELDRQYVLCFHRCEESTTRTMCDSRDGMKPDSLSETLEERSRRKTN